jgi:pyridoxamine 5'-phosphate oxidase
MIDKELRQVSIKLMETAQAVYLTTNGPDGYPHTRAMLNLRNKRNYPDQVHLFDQHHEDMMILISTNTASSKLRQIQVDSRVCVYYCLPVEFHGIMLAGDIEIVDDAQLRHALWNEGWEQYYPSGPDDPDHTVLRLYPKYVEGWYQSRRFNFALKSV